MDSVLGHVLGGAVCAGLGIFVGAYLAFRKVGPELLGSRADRLRHRDHLLALAAVVRALPDDPNLEARLIAHFRLAGMERQQASNMAEGLLRMREELRRELP